MKSAALLTFLAAALAGSACAAPPQNNATKQAAAVFAKYTALEHSFDQAMADLYCDSALIRNTRKYPTGQTRTLEFPSPKYKALIRVGMPIAKVRGDYATYSEVSYSPEGKNVRVRTTRYSALKKYSSPMSLLVGSCNVGAWSVLEEIGESQP